MHSRVEAPPALLRRTDPVLLWGPVVLCALAPLAAGSVEAWSSFAVVAGSAALAAVWLVRLLVHPESCAAARGAGSHLGGWSAGLHRPLIVLGGIGLLQLAPLGTAVGVLSPVSAELQQLAGVPPAGASLSLARGSTRLALAHGTALVLLFFAVLDSCHGRTGVRRLATSLVSLGFAYAVGAILWHYARGRGGGWAGEGVPFGPYVNRNHFACLMGMLVPLGLGLLLSLGHRRLPPPRLQDEGAGPAPAAAPEVRTRQFLCGFAVAVMAGAVFLSLSRGGIAATLLALSAVALLTVLARRTRRAGWIAAAATAAALGFGLWLSGEPFLARLSTFARVSHDPSAAGRLGIWADTLSMAADFPLFGSGLGSYAEVFPRYQTALAKSAIDHAHNDWLQLLAEGGLAVALAALAVVARYLVTTIRLLARRRDREAFFLALGGLGGLFAFLVHGVTDFNLHIPANALWFTVIAALTLKAVASRIGPA